MIEFKLTSLHAFIVFFEKIPLDLPSDAFVCNFICKSFAYGIRNCQNSEELQGFSKAVKLVLEKLLPGKVDIIRQSLNELLTILKVIEKEGLKRECGALTEDMKNYLQASGEDVVDYAALSQSPEDRSFSTLTAFTDNIKQQISTITNPRYMPRI